MKKVLTKKLLALLCTGVIGLSLFYACKKKELPPPEQKTIIKEKFFEIPPGTDSIVAAIAGSVKRQNDKRNFLPRLIENAGLPVWNKAKVMMKSPQEGKQVFIPFMLESKKTTRAILIVKLKGTDTLYHLLYNTQARQYGFDTTGTTGNWTARDIFHAFIVFDHELFGYTKFTVHEKKLINDTVGDSHLLEILKTGNSPEARENNIYPVTTWVTFVTCGLCGFKNTEVSTSRCCNAQYNLVPVTYWFNEEEDSWGYYTPEGGFQLSGGGGPAGSICVGCNWEDTNPCALDQYGHAVNFCDEDWEPEVVLPVYSPLNYSDIHIASGLETIFPCVASFIKDSLENANFLAQIAGANIFKDSVTVNLTFDTSTVYKTDTDYSAVTDSKSVMVRWGITEYEATIYINPWHLRHGTKEFMVSNILHEIMHAVFTLRWGQYQRWLINHDDNPYDSNYIKSKFPIYWYYIQNQTTPLTVLQEHDLMAADYLSQFTTVMNSFYNPAAPTFVRDSIVKALGYHGLHETTVWKSLPATGIDTCKYKAIEVAAERSSTNSSPKGCPTSYHYNYSTDLKMRPACQ